MSESKCADDGNDARDTNYNELPARARACVAVKGNQMCFVSVCFDRHLFSFVSNWFWSQSFRFSFSSIVILVICRARWSCQKTWVKLSVKKKIVTKQVARRLITRRCAVRGSRVHNSYHISGIAAVYAFIFVQAIEWFVHSKIVENSVHVREREWTGARSVHFLIDGHFIYCSLSTSVWLRIIRVASWVSKLWLFSFRSAVRHACNFSSS